jgi:hypothetical protein
MIDWEPVVQGERGAWIAGARDPVTGRVYALTYPWGNQVYECMTRWGARREARALVKRLRREERTTLPLPDMWEPV